MHARGIESVAHFRQHDFAPSLSELRRRPVADPVCSDNDDMRLWSLAQETRKAAHEYMEAAIGFEVAVDEGNYLICASKPCLIHSHTYLRIGNQHIRIDTVEDDRNALPTTLRKLNVLPVRGCYAPIALRKTFQDDAVFDPHPMRVYLALRECRVEPNISTRSEIEFKKPEDRAIRKYVLEEEGLAPPGMGTNDIWDEALALKSYCDVPYLLRPLSGDFASTQITMNRRWGQRGHRIGETADRAGFILPGCQAARLPNGGHRMLAISCKVRCKMPVLTREILVDEQKMHENLSHGKLPLRVEILRPLIRS